MKMAWTLAAAVSIIVLCHGAAFADPHSDLMKMQKAFLAVTSFHSDTDLGNGQSMSIDFVAPGTYHEIMPGGMETVITPTSMKVKQGGQWIDIPSKFTGNALASISNARAAISNDDFTSGTITDLGMDGGFHKYLFESHGAQTFTWVRRDNLPDHMETTTSQGTVTIRYSHYNEPIPIP
jgi:hypothetical protein